jgi:hypothetical protein
MGVPVAPSHICGMKLFLLWLLGVPLIVGGMVLARSLVTPPALHADPVHACLRQPDKNVVVRANQLQMNAIPCANAAK